MLWVNHKHSQMCLTTYIKFWAVFVCVRFTLPGRRSTSRPRWRGWKRRGRRPLNTCRSHWRPWSLARRSGWRPPPSSAGSSVLYAVSPFCKVDGQLKGRGNEMTLNCRKIRLIESNAKCCHLKKWPVKGLCGRCLSEFIIDWWYSQLCWYFRPCFENCCTSNLLSG